MSESATQTIRGLARDAHQRLLAVHRSMILGSALHELARDPEAALDDDSKVLADLVYGWNNDSWSAETDLLRGCIQEALGIVGPILECGSGLTTLVLGVVAQRTGNRVLTLEHMSEWARRVRVRLERHRIDSVQILESPLIEHGGFSWYEPPLEAMSTTFGLVVCDGPPAQTPGGRYGLIPVMRNCFKAGAVILLDDAEREAEQTTASRWSEELRCQCELRGARKPYFRLVL